MTLAWRSIRSELVGGTQEHFIDFEVAGAGEDERDDLSDVATTPSSMRVTRMSGTSSCRRDSDQPLRPHLVAA